MRRTLKDHMIATNILLNFSGTLDWEAEKTPEMEELISEYYEDTGRCIGIKSLTDAPSQDSADVAPIEDRPEIQEKYSGLPTNLDAGIPKKEKEVVKVEEKPNPEIICSVCGYTTRVKGTYNSHMANSHGRSGVHSCHHCGITGMQNKEIQFPTLLAEHILKCQPDAKLEAKCFHCNELIPFRKENLIEFEAHVLRCGRERIYSRPCVKRYNTKPCDLCGKAFTHALLRKRHMIVAHGQEPPFKCDQCEFWDLSSKKVKRHKLTHLRDAGLATSDDYTPCHICGKKFLGDEFAASLRAHLNSHKAALLHCPEEGCDFTTRRRQMLRK